SPNIFTEESLAPILAHAEIATSAVVAHENLKETLGNFDIYDDRYVVEKMPMMKNALTSELVTKAAQEQLNDISSDGNFLSFVHYYDIHSHYVKNELFDFGRGETNRYNAEV